MKTCENSGTRSKDTTALQGRQNMQQEMDMLKSDWEMYASSVRSLKENLERAIRQWGKYDDHHEKISAWIRDMDKKVKDFPLKSTLEEKQQQYSRYQVCDVHIYLLQHCAADIRSYNFTNHLAPSIFMRPRLKLTFTHAVGSSFSHNLFKNKVIYL